MHIDILINYTLVINMSAVPYIVENYMSDDTIGLDLVLTNSWTIWFQPVNNHGKIHWNSDNIIPRYQFSTIAGLWTLMNIITIDLNARIIIMRTGVLPVWEDPIHINGGYCLIHLNNDDCYKIFMVYLFSIVSETFTNAQYDSSNITGVTLVNNMSLKQIRIWVSNDDQSIITNIDSKYLDMLHKSSIIKFVAFDNLMHKKSKSSKHLQ